jgi:hypothetical protein
MCVEQRFHLLLLRAITAALVQCERRADCRLLSLMTLNAPLLPPPDLHVYCSHAVAAVATDGFGLYAHQSFPASAKRGCGCGASPSLFLARRHKRGCRFCCYLCCSFCCWDGPDCDRACSDFGDTPKIAVPEWPVEGSSSSDGETDGPPAGISSPAVTSHVIAVPLTPSSMSSATGYSTDSNPGGAPDENIMRANAAAAAAAAAAVEHGYVSADDAAATAAAAADEGIGDPSCGARLVALVEAECALFAQAWLCGVRRALTEHQQLNLVQPMSLQRLHELAPDEWAAACSVAAPSSQRQHHPQQSAVLAEAAPNPLAGELFASLPRRLSSMAAVMDPPPHQSFSQVHASVVAAADGDVRLHLNAGDADDLADGASEGSAASSSNRGEGQVEWMT